jgi:hypothetical protein
MAKANSIGRLHAEPKGPAESVQRELTDNYPGVPIAPERPVLRRFKRPSAGAEQAYTLDGPELMAIMHPSDPIDRSADLRALAAQQQILQLARARSGQRGGAGNSGLLIQA